jgi:hypothetical protein
MTQSDSDDTEMTINETGAGEMAAGTTDNGTPVDEDGTADADGGTEGGQTPLADGPLTTPIREVLTVTPTTPTVISKR